MDTLISQINIVLEVRSLNHDSLINKTFNKKKKAKGLLEKYSASKKIAP